MARAACSGLIALLLAAVSLHCPAEPLKLLRPALVGGRLQLETRLRWEQVDEVAALRTADAFTQRIRLGYATSKWNRLQMGAEYSAVLTAAAEEFQGPGNGRSEYSRIDDGGHSGLETAWLRWQAPYAFTASFGRQRLEINRGRFLGSDDFRQQAQRFDGLTIDNDYLPETRLQAAWLYRQSDVLGRARSLQAEIFRAEYSGWESASIEAYAYLLDFAQEDAGHRDTRTLGARYAGQVSAPGPTVVRYVAELAQQSHFADTPAGLNARYALLQLEVEGPTLAELTKPSLQFALERLGGDGRHGFATPLASLHNFQGDADVFTETPAQGLRDFSVALRAQRNAWQGRLAWHHFDADEGAKALGEELDAALLYAPARHWQLGGQVASYRAASFGNDTRKAWLWVSARY